MAYIGSSPTSGSFTLLDSISTSASASFTMQKNSVNFEPQSANHMIVSLNGTIQAPVSSFTVSGSTITFASALTSSDVIDFILVLGNVNDVGTATTVVDSAITKNKLNLISDSSSAGLTVKGDGSSENGTIALNCSSNSHAVKISSPSHASGQSYEMILPATNITAGKFLKVDSVSGSGATGIGQLSFADAGTNTPAFHVNFGGTSSTSVGHDTGTKMAFDSEEFDTDNAYDNSSNYRFTPQVAGKYFAYAQVGTGRNSDDHNKYSNCEIKKNGTTVLTSNENNSFYNTSATRGLIDMNGSSDYLECFYYHTFGTTISVDASNLYSYFGGFRIIS